MDKSIVFAGSIFHNAELYLPYVMKAVYPYLTKWVVVDDYSTDRTVEILKQQDPENKIIILQHKFLNHYSDQRNIYLRFIRDHLWTPDLSNSWYFRIDGDEIYQGNLKFLFENFIPSHLDKQGFRFNFANFDSSYFTLNEITPKETRANLFRYNPSIKSQGSIHEMPYYSVLQNQIPLYGAEQQDLELGIQEVPAEIGHYSHFSYTDFEQCKQKALNYTTQYVKQGTVTQEKLDLLKSEGPGSDWWWTDHKSEHFANAFAYPVVLKGAPFLMNPPFKLIFEDGSYIQPGTS